MDVQATGEAFSTQKRTSSTSKNVIYYIFLIFALLDPNQDCQSVSGDLIESGSNFFKQILKLVYC
jgi:hypothetical protein